MSLLAFTVLGKPQPAGSKRAFAIRKAGVPTGRVAVTDANPKAKSWQGEVRDAAVRAFMAMGPLAVIGREPPYLLLDGPLAVSMTFYVMRPKSHYRTGKHSDKLKPSAPPFPAGRPDALKLARGTEDALTGTVWRDDAQVVDLAVHKRYGLPERCEVVVRDAMPTCSVAKFGVPERVA